jgi:hypothetical protein
MCGRANATGAQAGVQDKACMESAESIRHKVYALCGIAATLLTLCGGSWRLLHWLLLNAAAECISVQGNPVPAEPLANGFCEAKKTQPAQIGQQTGVQARDTREGCSDKTSKGVDV